MMRFVPLAILCFASLFVAAQLRQLSPEEQIRSVLADQVSAWNKGDLEEYMDGYWRSDSTEFVSGGSVTRGYNEVLSRYRRTYSNKEEMGRLEFSDLSLKVFGNSAAVVSGIWKLRRSADTPWGRFTLLLEKKSGSWKITHDHTSTARD